MNIDPTSAELKDPSARALITEGLLKQLQGKIGEPTGYVLPMKPRERKKPAEATEWASSLWPLATNHLYLVEGDSPVGFRLPLNSLPWVAPADMEIILAGDPFGEREALSAQMKLSIKKDMEKPKASKLKKGESAKDVVRTALCVEVRNGILHVFFPPLELIEDYLALVAAVEATAKQTATPVRIEGYTPPSDDRLKKFAVTPDPGVIEFNIQPSATWRELVSNTKTLYEEARLSRLGTEKFMLDGKHTGTGGGNHVTVGGVTPKDSPMLRRPDLLRSLITYWQNHPALSYLFSGTFIGPTSQSPRVDEARSDTLYELEIAFEQMEAKLTEGDESEFPWLEMSLTQTLLLRALISRFWKTPYKAKLVRWGTELHDRFMLPYFVAQDMKAVVDDLNASGYAFKMDWFAPFIEFRFPRFGTVAYQGVELELRQAIEPWHVLGEEMAGSGTARYVDSSLERMQVKVSGMVQQRHVVACNGRVVPLTPTGTPGEFVAGVRYRAWAPASALHPTIGVHAPLVFDLVDLWSGRSVGGCTYHVSHPGGRNYATFPVNANEAEARRVARFQKIGHTPGPLDLKLEGRNPAFPFTLDLRRAPDFDGAQLMPKRLHGGQ